jgi:hypothetical protein
MGEMPRDAAIADDQISGYLSHDQVR